MRALRKKCYDSASNVLGGGIFIDCYRLSDLSASTVAAKDTTSGIAELWEHVPRRRATKQGSSFPSVHAGDLAHQWN
jgi:hypothetical protein